MTELEKINLQKEVATVVDPMVSMIERVVMDPEVSIDRLEKMLDMKERIEADAAKKAFSSAFAKMQITLPIIPEHGTILNSQKEAQSRYPLWEDVIEGIQGPLSENGFGISFDRRRDDEKIVMIGILTHEMGHERRAEIDLPADTSGSKNAVQAQGSTVSYGQRYTSKMLVNWRSECSADDDGKLAGAGTRPLDMKVVKALNDAWNDGILDTLPENVNPREKAEAFTTAICAGFARKGTPKSTKALENEWDRRKELIDWFEEKHPDLHAKVVDAYEIRHNDLTDTQ